MEENSEKRKSRGGRPPKPQTEKMSVRHNLKISANDEVVLQEDFTREKQGRALPFETYLRERLLRPVRGKSKKGKVNKAGLNSLLVTLIELRRILQGISVNYNQSMRQINNLSDTTTLKHGLVQQAKLGESADKLIEEIKGVIHRIKQEL